MSEVVSLARPYARAAYELAQASATLDEWGLFLSTAAEVMASNDVSERLHDPRFPRDWFQELLQRICEPFLTDERQRYLNVLSKKDRLNLLPAIHDLFEAYRAKDEVRLSVDVYSAFPLNDHQKTALETSLQHRFKQTIQLTTHVDEKLLGGLKIRAGDVVVDCTIRQKIVKLIEQLNVKEALCH
ncbi:MAG: F0F1 ATP synthase subunit delta [Gammaproteobacteria bacterium]